MFCYKCGAQIRDDSIFCSKCGCTQTPATPTETQPEVFTQPKVVAQPEVFTQAAVVAPKESPRLSPVNNARVAVAGFIRSPLFLIITIAMTLIHILDLFGLFTSTIYFGIAEYLITPLWQFNNSYYFYEFFWEYFAVFYSIFGDISHLLKISFDLLLIIGLWITYASAGKQGKRLCTGGLVLVKISTILRLIWNCILCIVFLICASIGAVDGSDAGVTTFVYTLIFLPVTLILEIIYSVKICSSLSAVKKTVTTGISTGSVSVFVAIICFLQIGYSLFSYAVDLSKALLGDYFWSYIKNSFSFSGILSTTVYILVGILILLYIRKISQLKNNIA